MEFASDNTAGAHDAVLAAILEANAGAAPSYGYDDWSRKAEDALSESFGTETAVFLVLTGTAANALALSAICPSYGAVVCHAEAHIVTDECGAVEMMSGGGRLMGLRAPAGKIEAKGVRQFLDGLIRGEHESKPCALSITQSTELGTVYSIDEVRTLGSLCEDRGLKLHMDGSRFANAVAGLGCQPADMTWKAGVDVMSFGATKNGALALEAVVFFDKELARDFRYRRKRGGQLLSKGRFLGAQMLAYLKEGLWLSNAMHANDMARRLADRLSQIPKVRLPLPTQANEVFAIMPRPLHEALLANGAHYYEWPGEGPGTDKTREGECLVRFVASYRTSEDEVDCLINLAKHLAN